MSATPSGRDLALGLPGALATGVFIAVQARINAQLGSELGDGVLAALISFGLGLVLLLALVAALPSVRVGLRRALDAGRTGRLRPWHYAGGLGGAVLVASQGLTAAALGVALFTVAVVAGQSSGGLAVDRAGLGATGAQALTPPRVLGAVLMLGAVALSVAPSLSTSAPVALALLPLVAGAMIAVQQAFNGRVAAAALGDAAATGGDPSPGSRLRSVVVAATVNFVVGTTALAVAASVSVAVAGPPDALPRALWLYLGGPLGAMFIGLATWVVSHVGVLLFSLGAVSGQVLSAVAIDTIVPSAAGRPGLTTVVGAVLTVLAAAVALLPVRRRSPTS